MKRNLSLLFSYLVFISAAWAFDVTFDASIDYIPDGNTAGEYTIYKDCVTIDIEQGVTNGAHYRFYKDKMIFLDAKPNPAHLKMAELEKAGKCLGVVTQNIDGLHTMAGSKTVYELHGTIHRNYCMKCGREYPLEYIVDSEGVPRCECGGTVKPDVVLYEEGLDGATMNGAVRMINKADCLVITGTSLVVYPAAGLVNYFEGKYLVVINKTQTPRDSMANLCINDSVGKVLSQIEVRV